MATLPRWQRENWTEAERRYWTDESKVVGATSQAPGPWTTVDLPKDYHYLAPDGSEIRLLATVDAGGLAHCALPAGTIGGPVRHRTVKEIWWVVDGRGEVWRRSGLDEEVVEVVPGTGLTIPTGVSFQFRAFQDGPLRVVIGTLKWTPSLRPVA